MTKKRFLPLALLLSCSGAAVAMLIGLIFRRPMTGSASGRVVWVGLFFLLVFLGGCAGMHIALSVNKKYRVRRGSAVFLLGAVCAVLVAVIGGAGQWAFMYRTQEVEISTDIDMVLLLDASTSMEEFGYDDVRTEAGCQFVDSLEDNVYLQAISFNGDDWVDPDEMTRFLQMDSAGKTEVKTMIQNIDSVGGTNVNPPMEKAYDTLTSGRADANKAVLLVTDGDSLSTSFRSSIASDYLNADIKLFTIRITSSANPGTGIQDLVSLANSSGGYDTTITPAADGSIDISDMLEKLEEAFKAASETETVLSEDLLVWSETVDILPFAIRLLTFLLVSLFFGLGFYGRFSLPGLGWSLACGALGAILTTVGSGLGISVCLLAEALLLGHATVMLDADETPLPQAQQPEGGTVFHV